MWDLSPQPGIESASEGQVLTAKEAPPILLEAYRHPLAFPNPLLNCL